MSMNVQKKVNQSYQGVIKDKLKTAERKLYFWLELFIKD